MREKHFKPMDFVIRTYGKEPYIDVVKALILNYKFSHYYNAIITDTGGITFAMDGVIRDYTGVEQTVKQIVKKPTKEDLVEMLLRSREEIVRDKLKTIIKTLGE